MEPVELFAPDPGAVKPADFAGEYAFAHDGWPGTLTLHVQRGRSVRGSYRDGRFNQMFVVTGEIDREVRHCLTFVIHNFNWLDEQRFVGYLFTHGRHMLAGTTHWRDEPFGFVAGKEAFQSLGTYRTGNVKPADFVGEYDIHHDGRSGIVTLEHRAERQLTGSYQHESLPQPLPVTAEVDPVVGHAMSLRFIGDLRLAAVRLVGYLFTRPKNAVAGVIDGPAGPTGCYLARRG
jgi:hypothetical protein